MALQDPALGPPTCFSSSLIFIFGRSVGPPAEKPPVEPSPPVPPQSSFPTLSLWPQTQLPQGSALIYARSGMRFIKQETLSLAPGIGPGSDRESGTRI